MIPARRGQGLPLNTIIISIIVVVVLVVIILIFTTNIGGTNKTLNSCAAQGGSCSVNDPANCAGTVIEDATCSTGSPGTVCCVDLS